MSPFGGKTLGLANIRADLAVPGTQVQARVDGGHVGGQVVEHPVYEKERRRARGRRYDQGYGELETG